MSGIWFCPKLQDATLDMEFSTPGMEVRVIGPACDARWAFAIPLSRCPVWWDFEFSTMCVDHITVGALSDITLALSNFISTSLCSTKYCNITAAISKSEFVR